MDIRNLLIKAMPTRLINTVGKKTGIQYVIDITGGDHYKIDLKYKMPYTWYTQTLDQVGQKINKQLELGESWKVNTNDKIAQQFITTRANLTLSRVEKEIKKDREDRNLGTFKILSKSVQDMVFTKKENTLHVVLTFTGVCNA